MKDYQIFLISSGILLACLLLTKQLVIFSLLCLGAMVLTNIFLRSRGLKSILISLFAFFISFIAPVAFADLILEVPRPYVSHIQYILEIGGRIGDIISSYGFNMWIFFYKDTLVSSHTPLFDFAPFLTVGVTPYSAGIWLFVLSNTIFLISLLRYFYELYKSEVRFFRKSDILLWIFQLSFLNLSFNIFLTGTHERYLYHFYPFIIISFLGSSLSNRKELYILITGAFLYGSFLFGYLSNMLLGRFPFYAMAVFHFLLFV